MDFSLKQATPDAPLIELRGLTKSYIEGESEHVIFHDLNASIRRGEFAALLGRSGSGKSTLLNLISGIDVPTAGEVMIAGTCLTRLSEHQRTLFRRENIGFVFQFYNLIPTLTVEENLLLPLELKGVVRGPERLKALEFLDQGLTFLVIGMIGVFPVLSGLSRFSGNPLPDLNRAGFIYEDDEMLVSGFCYLLFYLAPGRVIRDFAVHAWLTKKDLDAPLFCQALRPVCAAVNSF